MNNGTRTSLFFVALLLVACNTAPLPIKDSPPVDDKPHGRDYSDIINGLPADADKERLAEQAEWVPRGIYIDRSGEFRPLPSDTSTRTSALAGRPSIKEQPARPADTRRIVLPLPKEAYGGEQP